MILPTLLVWSGLKRDCAVMRIVLIAFLSIALLPGCAMPPGLFAEVSGNVQHRTGASDWTLPGNREYIGQVQAVVGVEARGLSVFAGFNHLSMPQYGHDRGFNGEVVGVSYRHYFLH